MCKYMMTALAYGRLRAFDQSWVCCTLGAKPPSMDYEVRAGSEWLISRGCPGYLRLSLTLAEMICRVLRYRIVMSLLLANQQQGIRFAGI